MTGRAALAAHLEAHHRRIAFHATRGGNTLADLAREHARDHWRFAGALDHLHAGPNTGPGDRPPGWRTGADVVTRVRP